MRSVAWELSTSDNERTKLSLDTTNLLMCINVHGEEMPIDDTVALTLAA